MFIKQLSSVKISNFHLIGSTLLLLTAISISFIIDHKYQLQNSKALSIGLRADQTIEDYYQSLEEELQNLEYNYSHSGRDIAKIRAFAELKTAMFQLNEVYHNASEALLPLPKSAINRHIGSKIDFQDLNNKQEVRFRSAYRHWQDLVHFNGSGGRYQTKALFAELKRRKPFRKVIRGFSFDQLRDLSRAKAYWQLKLQQLAIIAELQSLEKELLPDLQSSSSHYQYHIQSNIPQASYPLGQKIKLKSELLRTVKYKAELIKVLNPGYKLIEKGGNLYLSKIMNRYGNQEEEVQLEVTNPLTGQKENISLSLSYFVHP